MTCQEELEETLCSETAGEIAKTLGMLPMARVASWPRSRGGKKSD